MGNWIFCCDDDDEDIFIPIESSYNYRYNTNELTYNTPKWETKLSKTI